ncbi:MAG: LacI family transcriptional regulator [Phycisphaerae bacterium]|nr:LacI family transcriptional regulator [Phycisphaerae bacterium]
MSVTIVDIAKKATVSVGTVSRVLNNNPTVGLKHKQRVMAAMAEMNFQPNRWARKIQKDSTKTGQIALLFINVEESRMHTSYMMQYIHGAQQEITGSGRKCLFLTWNETPGDDAIPNILLDGEIDGIIMRGYPRSEIGRQWMERYPRVSINPGGGSMIDCDCIMVDYQAGTRLRMEYLAARGHRRIAIVSPDETGYIQSKLIGYKQAGKDFGLDADDELIQAHNVPPESDFGWAIDNLWSLAKPPTAILSNDYSCGGIYKALVRRGLSIPGDVSIIGCDNSPNYCEALAPELTSLDICATDVGKAAVQRLFERMKNPEDTNRNILIQGRMVERESVRKL